MIMPCIYMNLVGKADSCNQQLYLDMIIVMASLDPAADKGPRL